MSYNLSQIGSRLCCILKYITNILLINRNTNKYKNIVFSLPIRDGNIKEYNFSNL